MRTPSTMLSVALMGSVFVAACGSDDPVVPSAEAAALEPDDPFSGGEGTVFDITRDAFNKPMSNLKGARRDDFFVGNAVFSRGWVTAPASVADFDGLGPLFNATNCASCHFKDGRGRPPVEAGEEFLGMLVRLSVPGSDAHGGPKPEPTYGDQLQGNAIRGVPLEGHARVDYTERPGAFADGEPYSLRVPAYRIEEPGYGPLAPDVMLSPRVAPAMAGMGLLEAIPEATLLAKADPDDTNGDGISGRANYVWDVAKQAKVIGRFGWKANQPGIRQQDAAAFLGDMGITSTMFGTEGCSGAQALCASSFTGDVPQLRKDIGDTVDFYVFTLAVPGRRDIEKAEVKRGRVLFHRSGCSSCHTPTIETGDAPDFPETAQQTIHPYSDLLLHDMGPDLADHRPDFEASGTEWRTPPLWGIGLIESVNKHTFFLHDGRARGFAEAILWHGGEGAASAAAFVEMPNVDRDALVAFLGSL